MPVEARLPLPVVALNVTMRIHTLLFFSSNTFPKFTVMGVLANVAAVVMIDGNVVKQE